MNAPAQSPLNAQYRRQLASARRRLARFGVDAEDAVHDAWVIALEAGAATPTDAEASRAAERLRGQARASVRRDVEVEEGAAVRGSEGIELAVVVRELAARLDAAAWEALVEAVDEEEGVARIAAREGVSERTAQRRVAVAREAARAVVGEGEDVDAASAIRESECARTVATSRHTSETKGVGSRVMSDRLAEELRRIERAHPKGREVIDAMRGESLDPTYARVVNGHLALVRGETPAAWQERFGVAPELLVVLVSGEVQARDLEEADREIFASGLRLDWDLVIVANDAPDLKSRLARMPGRPMLRVPWALGESRWNTLEGALRAALPTYDVFEQKDPVRGRQVLGREREIRELQTRVERAQAVGLFGLRKVGKTTLVRAVTDFIDPASSGLDGFASQSVSPDRVALYVDAQGVLTRHVDAVADELLSALADRMSAAQDGFPVPRSGGLVAFKDAVERLFVARRARFVIAIDEYDFLFEDSSGRTAPVEGLVDLLRLLRAWSQTRGAVALVLLGRDPEHLAASRIAGAVNPLLGWLTAMHLHGLDADESRSLLSVLGQRAGLRVGARSVARAITLTGGHPRLLRVYGSRLFELCHAGHGTREWLRDADPFADRAAEAFLAHRDTREIAEEVVDILQARYPDVLELLREIAIGGASAADLRAHMAEAVTRAQEFGLLFGADDAVPEYLRRYLQRYTAPSQMRRAAG
ncbi:MAG: hypothetical protein R3A52_06965 [Polyangiales bacterium]